MVTDGTSIFYRFVGKGNRVQYKAVAATNTTSTRFIGNTTSTEVDADEAWVSPTPTAGSIDLPDAMQSVVIVSGDDITIRCLTGTTDSGAIQFVCFWEPVSAGATLVAA